LPDVHDHGSRGDRQNRVKRHDLEANHEANERGVDHDADSQPPGEDASWWVLSWPCAIIARYFLLRALIPIERDWGE